MRSAELVRRQRETVRPRRALIERQTARHLNRIAMQQPAFGMNPHGDLADRLDHAGLAIGGLHADHHAMARCGELFKPAVQHFQINQTRGQHRQQSNTVGCKTVALQHARMFGGQHQQRIASLRLDATQCLTGQQRRQCQPVGLGRPAGKNHIAGIGPAQGGNPVTRLIDHAARLPALVMGRRGIANQCERRKHGLARLVPKR